METAASSYAILRTATSWKVPKMFSVSIMVPGVQTPKGHFVKVNNNSILIIENYYEALFNVIFRWLSA